MSRLNWDATGSRYFEAGVDHGVLYVSNGSGGYNNGVVWNGLTSISESPEGAEATDLWADNMKYATLRSAETFGGTIEAYTYPEEFGVCDGTASPIPGIQIGQQARRPFGLSYRTKIGSDTHADIDAGYLLHIVYGATASPSERSYETINDSPDAITFSWEFDTTPVNVEGYKPISTITINSMKTDPTILAAIENLLYGTVSENATLPSPAQILALVGTTTAYTFTAVSSPAATANPQLSGWYVVKNGVDSPDTSDPDDFELTSDTTVKNNTTYYTRVVTTSNS